jgi:hypothetical protein
MLKLDLYFTVHTVEMFTSTLERLFSTADIIVTENAAKESSRFLESVYEDLSAGKTSVEDAMTQIDSESYERNGFRRMDPMYNLTFFRMIAGSRKRIYVEHSPLTRGEAEQYLSAGKPPNTSSDMIVYLKSYENKLRSEANCHVLRDRELAVQLAGLSKENPESRILVLRGAAHQRILEGLLREQGLKFKSYLSDKRAKYILENAIVSKFALGMRVKTKELAMAAIQNFELDRLSATSSLTVDDMLKSYNRVAAMPAHKLEVELYAGSLGYAPRSTRTVSSDHC